MSVVKRIKRMASGKTNFGHWRVRTLLNLGARLASAHHPPACVTPLKSEESAMVTHVGIDSGRFSSCADLDGHGKGLKG
jgi:hypothetical protein